MESNIVDFIAGILLIVGAITWGVIGVTEMNVIELALEPVFQPTAAEIVVRAIYVLVGLAGLYSIYMVARMGRDLSRRR